MDNDAFIDQILMKISSLVEATGLSKALIIIEIVQMINTLKKGIHDTQEGHKKEKEILIQQIDSLNKKLLGDVPEGDEIIGGETFHIHLGPMTEEAVKDGNE